jgi:hypothetical protein
MHDRLRLTQAKMPDEIQLELLAPWYTQNTSESRTLDFFDAIPKYPFAVTTTIPKPERLEVPFSLRGKKYVAFVAPAQITDAKTGQERLVFPGGREELVERALRFIAVQQIARTRLIPDAETGRQAVTVFFTLSMLRRHLEDLGHGFKLSAIKEALDILSATLIEIRVESDNEPQSKRRRFMKGTILTNYTGDFAEGDPTGEDSRAAMTFHPLATQAILDLAFYPINQLRVAKLKRPLARWLTTRMSHNYRQARKNGFVHNEGYHISLKTILDERALAHEARLWNNVKSVREALTEMKNRRILSEMRPFDEKLIHAPSKGRPKIVDAIWTLYPSPEFVDEVIVGNKQMERAHRQPVENKGESRLLPGFQEEARPGQIGVKVPKVAQKAGANRS